MSSSTPFYFIYSLRLKAIMPSRAKHDQWGEADIELAPKLYSACATDSLPLNDALKPTYALKFPPKITVHYFISGYEIANQYFISSPG